MILADESTTYVSNMQEESLFRRTTHLTKNFYPILHDEALLARHVGCFSLTEDFNDYSIKFFADFIACPGLKNFNGDAIECEIFENKIRLIFDIAIKYNYNSLILGALGTGAFYCNPKHVANCFKKIILEYNGKIENIVFAITGNKYNIFKDIIDTN